MTALEIKPDHAKSLVNYGRVIRGWMGLEVQTIFMSGAASPSLLVTGTHPDGPAARAGIREGDIITHIDMEPVVDGQITMNQIALLRPGDAVELSLLRDNEDITVNVIVGSRPVAESAGS